ncbi:MAG: DUF1385 domain-containing protein [Chloroflexota bacterium]|nr:MAG: DUF1385 domain-containing protein [Chloroflexota bacterium]
MAAEKPFYYGGQALIEGVMMRGRENIAIAVRRPDGDITVTSRPLANLYKGHFRNWPLIRGITVLIETLAIGIQSLLYSAQIAAAEEDENGISTPMLWGSLVIAVAFAIGLFFVLPLLLTRYLIDPHIASALVSNIIEGILRIGIFIAYVKAISLMPDLKRVFAYHGAEHKVVNAHESGTPLELDYVKNYSTSHTRCGTSFLLTVLIIAIFVFALLGRPPLWISILSRIVLIPVIAAIGYEFVRFGAAYSQNRFVRGLLAPGLKLQAMTTREPDDRQLETAISALKKAIEVDSGQPEEKFETKTQDTKWQSEPIADKTRQSLVDITNLYLDLLVDNDLAKLPVSSNIRFTENGNEIKLGKGLWQTATDITYRQYFVDPSTGQVLFFGVVDEDGTLANLMVRLKVTDNKIEEIETIVCRKGQSSVASPESLVTPKPVYDEIVPESERSSRDKVIAIANSYFDGLEQNSAENVPFHPSCNRTENGFQTTNNPINKFLGMDAASQLKLFTYITKVRDRRFFIIDEKRGLVGGIFIFDCPETRSILLAEVFKVISGQIREIEALMVNTPYGQTSGWQ